MIRAEGLTKRFPAAGKRSRETLAVDSVDLEVHPGEVFGFLGPNGAGKTTIVRMLCALIQPSAGKAWVNGHEIGPENDAVRASVGILTESPGLYGKLDALTNLSFFARLYGVEEVDSQVEKYLRMLGLWDARFQPAGSFSKGMRQKLAIARALLHEPRLVFLDEPTASLDPEAARVVRDFISELRGQGRTIVLCTHNLDEADRLCDRIGLIRQRFIRVDSPLHLRQELYGARVRIRLAEVLPHHCAAVQSLPFVRQLQTAADSMSMTIDQPLINNPRLINALVASGAQVQYLEEEKAPLESIYFDLMRQAEEESQQP